MYEVIVVHGAGKGKVVVGAGDYSYDRFGQEEVHAVRVARSKGGGASSDHSLSASYKRDLQRDFV